MSAKYERGFQSTFLNAEVDIEALRCISDAIRQDPYIPAQSLQDKAEWYLSQCRPSTIFVSLYAAALLESPTLTQKIRF
jgi:hypothetical protein